MNFNKIWYLIQIHFGVSVRKLVSGGDIPKNKQIILPALKQQETFALHIFPELLKFRKFALWYRFRTDRLLAGKVSWKAKI